MNNFLLFRSFLKIIELTIDLYMLYTKFNSEKNPFRKCVKDIDISLKKLYR